MSLLGQFFGKKQAEGEGATVCRIIGGQQLPDLNPLLMLDYFSVKLPGGFPDHPHRGFETVTYLTQGSIWHEDFKGNCGQIKTGDIQWMTAGRGIIHAEMPGSHQIVTKGFQLWVNLPKGKKMMPAAYQEYLSENISEYNDTDGN